jgi:hypothetical protein
MGARKLAGNLLLLQQKSGSLFLIADSALFFCLSKPTILPDKLRSFHRPGNDPKNGACRGGVGT